MIRHGSARSVRIRAGCDSGHCRHSRRRRLPKTSSIARCARQASPASRSASSSRRKPGYEAWARELLADSGKNVDAELPSVGALAVNSPPASSISAELCVVSCSKVSYVLAERRRAARGRPTPLQTRRSAQLCAPPVNTLLGTLGLTPIGQVGSGVTVALIDSGIYPSAAFARPHQGVLRLHRRRTRSDARRSTITVTARTSPA